ncbi:putative papain-like amidase enzyme [Phage f2b1]|nr:putative papain-like amidase enzyme [Phage f2b1]
MDIQPGDVIFYKPTSLVGWIISKLTHSDYSHVALAVDAYNIVEADKFIKSRVSNLYYVDSINSVYRLNNATDDQKHIIVNHALTMVGMRYDYKQIFGLFLRLTFRKDYSTFNTANKYICSEIVDTAFLMADVPRKDTRNLGDISPQELFEKYDLIRVY